MTRIFLFALAASFTLAACATETPDVPAVDTGAIEATIDSAATDASAMIDSIATDAESAIDSVAADAEAVVDSVAQ